LKKLFYLNNRFHNSHIMGSCPTKSMQKNWAIKTVDYNQKVWMQPRISICDTSRRICELLYSHHEGISVNLDPYKDRYSELHEDGTTYMWDLNRMATDFEEHWDGRNFDGQSKRASNRDDIGIVILKALIANGADPINLTSHGRTAFQIAALSGDLEFCKELVEKGVDIRKLDEHGDSALTLIKNWDKDEKDLSHIISYIEKLL